MVQRSFRNGLSAISSGASTITGWALAILGGTVVGLVGGKYLHPGGAIRYVYLLFLPGWLFLGASVFYGEKVTRRFTASAFTQEDKRLLEIGNEMNIEYGRQRLFFQLALLTFGIWLAALLIWWVWSGEIPSTIE
jgi:hypothetical protein